MIEKLVLRRRAVGFTDIYHERALESGVLGRLYILLFGTPHLGTFSNGIYIKRALKGNTFRNILDAGCGDGTFSFYVAARYPHCSVVGADIGEQGLHGTGSTLDVCFRVQRTLELPNLEFRKMDLLELSEKEAYDFIFSFDVLEHIKENKKVLRNFHTALIPGGRLLFRIPSNKQKRVLDPRFTAEHEAWAAVEHVGQHYDMPGLLEDLGEIGFRIVNAGYTNGFWGELAFELLEAVRYYKLPEFVRFGIVPVLKIFRLVDTLAKPRCGNGLLVLCEK